VLAAFAAAGVVSLLALVLPSDLRFLALIAAFVAGAALERFRHSYLPAPPSLMETPEAWRYLLRYEVGVGQLAIAAVLLAAAAAVLFISFGGDEGEPTPTTTIPPAAGPAPDLKVRRERPGRQFDIAGARFSVITDPSGATSARSDIEADGDRAIYIVVEVENRSRTNFNPVELDYRLRDAEGALYGATRSTAAGSDELVTTGGLPKGERVEQQLLFAVPRDARNLTIEFEPVPNGPQRLRVPIEAP
jgi:hypothetical protein